MKYIKYFYICSFIFGINYSLISLLLETENIWELFFIGLFLLLFDAISLIILIGMFSKSKE
jgi:hypothetical protein